MRRFLLRGLRAPALWYGLVGWLGLSAISALPPAIARWAPDAHPEWGLTAYTTVPNLEWQLLLIIATLTGIAAAWQGTHTRGAGAILGAIVAVTCASLGAWLVYWATTLLPPLLIWRTTPPPPLEPPLSYEVNLYIFILVVVSFIVVLIGAAVGAVSGLFGWILSLLERQLQRSLSAGSSK
jgi:hypothetical protein